MQAAFEQDEIILVYSDIYMFSLRKSIQSGNTTTAKPPESIPRLVEQAITNVDYKNSRLIFHNFAGDMVQSVLISGNNPYIGDNGNWYEWSDEALEYIDTGIYAQGVKGDQGSVGAQGEQGPAGPQARRERTARA